MSSLIENLRKELDVFWRWAGKTPKEYEENRGIIYLEECDYPNWIEIKELTSNAISDLKSGKKSKELAELILEFMAIDNEGEDTLDLCELQLSNGELEYLIESSLRFYLSNSRWQIAELIGRTNNKNLEMYLSVFIKDNNKYVQRKALSSLMRINSIKAEEVAISKLKDEDDYLRLVSFRILREVSSKYLQEAMNILKDDKFNYIQIEIEEIKSELL